MAQLGEGKLLSDVSSGRYHTVDWHDVVEDSVATTHIRLLVLDRDPQTPELIENALWIWPHRIATAQSVEQAVRMCHHLAPTAIFASLDFSSPGRFSVINALRSELPNAVIIALDATDDQSDPRAAFSLGANALLHREDIQRPTLHNLLMSLQDRPDVESVRDIPAQSNMPLAWRESQIIGSLICDIGGTITSANKCLANWLGYSTPNLLLGKSVWRDIMETPDDYAAWKQIGGDLDSILHQPISVKSKNKQLLWMKVQVFAAPNAPSNLQAAFVDQTELASLSGIHQQL